MKTPHLSFSKSFLWLALVFVLVVGSAAPVGAQAQPDLPQPGLISGSYLPGRLLVRLEQGVSINAGGRLLAAYGAQYQGALLDGLVQIWQVPEGRELSLAQQLNAEPEVLYAEPDYIYQAFDTIPNDPYYNKQWSHDRANAEPAWDLSTGSSDFVIAIVDTGVDLSHPDLSGKLVAGYDFKNNDSNPSDDNGHGTHVAGIAAANANNATGVAGVSWGARLMPVKVLDAAGSGSNSHIIDGIDWAYKQGADIINLSLGGPTYSQSMQDVINAAHSAGSLVVAAMGNCRTYIEVYCPIVNPTMYPAAMNNVFAVAATGPTNVYAPYSQYGAHCDIAAPGGAMTKLGDPNGIYSTMPTYDVSMTVSSGFNKNYDFVHGTSQATPYVAGLAALVWSYAPWLTADEVQTAIQNTVVDLGPAGWDSTYGHGLVNAYAALVSVQVEPAAPVLNAISNLDGDGNYTLAWNDVSQAESYILQEDDNASFTSPTQIYSGSSSQYAVSGRTSGAWYYRVRAVNQSGNSDWSNTRSVTVKPEAPSLDAIDNPANADAYLLDWSEPAGSEGYLLQEDDNNSFTSPVTRYLGSSSQYQVTGQPSGTWYYRVQAYNDGGNSPWSATRSTTVDAHFLPAPQLYPILNPEQAATFALDWDPVIASITDTMIYTYSLEQSSDIYFAEPEQIYTGTATVFTTTVSNGGNWYYRVRAIGPVGDSPWSQVRATQVETILLLPLVVYNSPSWQTILTENFEGTFPGTLWTLKDSSGSSNGEYLWAKSTCRVNSGAYSGLGLAGGADGAGLNCGDHYPANIQSWMTAGPFDLSAAQTVELAYTHWINLEYGETSSPDLEYDWLCYMHSADGTFYNGYCFSGYSVGWSPKVIDLTTQLAAYHSLDQIWFGFYFKTDGSVTFEEGAYLDDISIRQCAAGCSLAAQAGLVEDQGVPFAIELSP